MRAGLGVLRLACLPLLALALACGDDDPMPPMEDAGMLDSGMPDSGTPDSGTPDSGTPRPTPTPTMMETPDAGPAEVPPMVLSEASVPYAAVASIDLNGLGLPSDLTADAIEVTMGTADELDVVDGYLRFLTPADSGEDATLEFAIEVAEDDHYLLPITIRSERPTEVVAYVEGEAETSGDAVPTLVVEGLGSQNALLGGAMRFSVEGSTALDPLSCGSTITFPNASSDAHQTIAVANYWTYDSDTRSFGIDEAAMGNLLATLPAIDVTFTVNLVSLDGEFAYAWSFLAHKPSAMLTGQLVDLTDDSPITSADGKRVAVRGLKDNRTRTVAVVDAQGAFSVSGLPDGTYEAAVLDIYAPEFWKASFLIENSTMATLALPYQDGQAIQKSTRSKTTSTRASYRQDGTSLIPERRASIRKLAMPTTCETVNADGSVTYLAMASMQNQTIGCVVQHTIPQGAQQVGIELLVTSEEYPTYTTVKSQYNDTWSYAIAGISGFGSAGGSVNDTHYTQRTTTQQACVDVSALTQSGAHTFSASLKATNIGDSVVPTSVTLNVVPDCQVKLGVLDATIISPNAVPHHVVRPLNPSNNFVNNYISVPVGQAETAWGLPVNIRFQPADATITKVRMGLVVNGGAVMADEDLLPQATTVANGAISFASLVVPRFENLQRFAGFTNVVFELTGDVNGTSQTSDPLTGVATHAGLNTFVPLFLAGDTLDSSRRYGQGVTDVGDDSWSTQATIAWLTARSYRFNDITGLHAPQTSTGRSVLLHSGHSDGTQVDMRYADGMGGFSDSLGGANHGAGIKTLLDDAASEVAMGMTNGPKLAAATAWINANRNMIQSEAGLARAIYIGATFVKLALINGLFPDAMTAIPGVGAWTTKPVTVGVVRGHLNHWHLSRSSL